MKKGLYILLISFVSMLLLTPDAGAQDTIPKKQKSTQQQQFVDKDGDGYNDNAPDHDGDGIPNRLDPDWKKKKRKGQADFVDLDGDGVNDRLQTGDGETQQSIDLKAGEQGSSIKSQEQQQMRKGGKRKGKS